MGAPGCAYLCENGHVVHWIEEHLNWDDSLWVTAQKYKNSICLCGARVTKEFSHYGDINDCLDTEERLVKIGEDEIQVAEQVIPSRVVKLVKWGKLNGCST